jgi:DNA-binding HxlR family transcriptional regulator
MADALTLDDDYEVKVAVRLLDGPSVDLRILEQLVGQPRRYGELRSALKIKADMELNRALRRLLDLAIIDQIVDFAKAPPTKSYRLNPIGVHVFYVLGHIRAAHQTEAITRAIIEARKPGTAA